MGIDPSETIVIEDSISGVLAGKRAGLTVWGFTGGGHTYSALATRLAQAGAEYVCGSMDEVSRRLSSRSLM